MVDWLKDFEEAFGGHELISRLKELNFHGKVEINFNGGRPLAANVHMFCKPQVKMTIVSLTSVNQDR